MKHSKFKIPSARFCLGLFAFFIFHFSLSAATIITGTLTITNAANIDATNSASITVNTGAADTRIWTNAVVDPTTHILYTNSISQAAQRLLIHAATYPFASTYLSQSGTNGIILRAYQDIPLTITLTNTTWGSVTYATNTITAATVVRVPNTVESATTKTNVATGLTDYLNLDANTVALDQTKTVASQLVGLVNTQTIAGAKSLTNTANVFSGASLDLTGGATIGTFASIGTYLQLPHAALAVDSAATNFVADLTGQSYRTITATNDVFFVQSTNRAAARFVKIRIDPNGTNRNLGFNASWKFFGGIAPSTLSSNAIAVLTVTALGTAETDVLARYSLQNQDIGTLNSTDIDTSAELRTILTDESGTGAALFAGGDILAGSASTPSANDNDTSIATTAFVQTEISDVLDGGETWTGVQDFGAASSFELPNGAAPTVDAFGEIAGDNNQWAASRGAPVFFDGTESIALIGTVSTNAPTNGYVPKWQTGGTILWQADNTGGTISGTDTHVMFFDGTDTPAGEAGFIYNKTTDSATLVGDLTVATEAYDATGWNADLTVPTKDAVRDKLEALPVTFGAAASDETTALTAGTAKVTFRVPHAMTVTAVRASLTTAQTSGSIFTVDLNDSGTTILSTKITIDNTEKTSTTAVTAPVISDSALADDAEITVDIDQIGDSTAKGLKIWLIGTR